MYLLNHVPPVVCLSQAVASAALLLACTPDCYTDCVTGRDLELKNVAVSVDG